MEKESREDLKRYRIQIKEGYHLNQTVNPDGSVTSLQFSDETNGLGGPIRLFPDEDKELNSTDDNSNGFLNALWEEAICPAVITEIRRATYQVLEYGRIQLGNWMKEVALPAVKEKAKEIGNNIETLLFAIHSGVTGKELELDYILKFREDTQNITVNVTPNNDAASVESVAGGDGKIVYTKEDIQSIIDLMLESAHYLAVSIRLLSKAVVEDSGISQERKIEAQKRLEELTSASVMRQIDLLLDEKNRWNIDEESVALLTAFRNGQFIVAGKNVPISNYLPFPVQQNKQ